MAKYTAANLNKVEDIFKERGYIIRYEKGNFNSGYCILESKKVIIINKYFDNEAKINCLIDIFNQIEIDYHELQEVERSLIEQFVSKASK